MRVVLDTNVFVSGFRSKVGIVSNPKIAREMAVAGLYTLVLSEDICLEIEDVLKRKFGWSASFIASTLNGFNAIAEMVSPSLS